MNRARGLLRSHALFSKPTVQGCMVLVAWLMLCLACGPNERARDDAAVRTRQAVTPVVEESRCGESATVAAPVDLARERIAPRAHEIDRSGEYPQDMFDLLREQIGRASCRERV